MAPAWGDLEPSPDCASRFSSTKSSGKGMLAFGLAISGQIVMKWAVN